MMFEVTFTMAPRPAGSMCCATHLHIDIVPNRDSRPTYLLRESYRDGKKVRKRTLANLSALDDAQIEAIRAILRGDWRLHGFRNRDLLEELFGAKLPSAEERRRRSLRVCRQLQLLRAHGLIAKIAHSNRYKVTDKGDALMWSAVFLRIERFPKALNAVA